MDELVSYARQFEEGKSYSGGSYDSNLSFIQALTEALKAVPTAVLLASLPESDKEAGSQRGIAALASLSHYSGPRPGTMETGGDRGGFRDRAPPFVRRHQRQAGGGIGLPCLCGLSMSPIAPSFRHETQESHYFDRLVRAYPIPPRCLTACSRIGLRWTISSAPVAC